MMDFLASIPIEAKMPPKRNTSSYNFIFSDYMFNMLLDLQNMNLSIASLILVSRKLSKCQNKHFKLEINANTYAYLETVTTVFLRN